MSADTGSGAGAAAAAEGGDAAAAATALLLPVYNRWGSDDDWVSLLHRGRQPHHKIDLYVEAPGENGTYVPLNHLHAIRDLVRLRGNHCRVQDLGIDAFFEEGQEQAMVDVLDAARNHLNLTDCTSLRVTPHLERSSKRDPTTTRFTELTLAALEPFVNAKLEYYHVSFVHADDAALAKHFSLLRKCRALTSIFIEECVLGPKALQALAHLGGAKVTDVDIETCTVDPEGYKNFLGSLSKWGKLDRVELSDLKATDDTPLDHTPLFPELAKLPKLDNLRLINCGLTNADIRSLAATPLSSQTFDDLNISHNPAVTDECVAELRRFISREPKLNCLDVSSCGFSDGGLRDIAQSYVDSPEACLCYLLKDADEQLRKGLITGHKTNPVLGDYLLGDERTTFQNIVRGEGDDERLDCDVRFHVVPELVPQLVDAIEAAPQVEMLTLNFIMPGPAIDRLAEVVAQKAPGKKLKELNLYQCHVDVVDRLCEALSAPDAHPIKELIIYFGGHQARTEEESLTWYRKHPADGRRAGATPVGEASLRARAAALIRDTGRGGDGKEIEADALAGTGIVRVHELRNLTKWCAEPHCSLEKLEFSVSSLENVVLEEGFLGELLRTFSSLKHIDLDGNNFTPEVIPHILDNLRSNRRRSKGLEVECRGHKFGPQFKRDLADIIASEPAAPLVKRA